MEREKITIEELLQRYEKGERDFAGMILEHTNKTFHNVNLSGISLEGVELHTFGINSLLKVNYSGANLKGIALGEQFLEGVNFSEANLENVCFYQSVLRNSNLSRCNLSGADFRQASLQGANLIAANLTEANMGGIGLDGIKLTNVNLTRAINFWVDGGAIFDNTIMPDGSIRTD